MSNFISVDNSASFRKSDVPVLEFQEFRASVLEKLSAGCRVSAFFALNGNESKERQILCILLDPAAHKLLVTSFKAADSYCSLTPEAPQFHYFERELFENSGITPQGHPFLKPVRTTENEFFTMHGDAVNEVAVGPVHAGVIEPGHFRFQCMGEKVYSLEIVLGYQHRGVEELLSDAETSRIMPLFETASGDSAAAAACGAARAIESLCGKKVSQKAELLRILAIELERVANHTGDLGALAGDVAFLPTASFCGRIRGEYLNMTAQLCGNRFGRNFIVPGGVRYDVDPVRAAGIKKHLAKVNADLKHALDLMFASPTSLDRFENTGFVSKEIAGQLGLVGTAGRSSGVDADARKDLPYSGYEKFPVPAGKRESGDVLARASQRYDEILYSLEVIDNILDLLQQESTDAATPTAEFPELAADMCAVSVTEAWRGELCQFLATDETGKLCQSKIVDPSFHNWYGLSMALRDEEISNFPICNKSFNLSYCGHDL